MSDFKGLLRRHKAWFGEVASNTRNIRSVYSFETPQSIFDVNVVGDNMFSKLSEAKELERPAQKNDDEKKTDLKDDSRFAKLNINDCTKAVSEIFNFPFVAPIDEDQEAALRLAPTFFVNPFVDVRKLSDISKPMVPVPRFLPVNESFLRTKTYLHIASIHATVRGRYTAKEPGELNLEDKERLTQVQKVNEYWYWGTKDPPGTSETSTLDGLFERSWVLFGLGLYMPLKVRAKTASKRDESISCALCFEKGEELEIMVSHSPGQAMLKKILNNATNSVSTTVYYGSAAPPSLNQTCNSASSRSATLNSTPAHSHMSTLC